MKVKFRALLVATVGIIISLLVVLYYQTSDLKVAKEIFSEFQSSREKILTTVINLDGEPLKNFAFDYTYWDDMVDFVHSGDTAFADNNITPALKTYGASSVWVYRSDLTLRFATNTFDDPGFRLPLTSQQLKAIFSTQQFGHFFIKTDKGVFEIRTAPIQPSSDVDRKTPAQGYFVVGKAWDQNYINTMQNITNLNLSVLEDQSKTKLPNDNAKKGEIVLTRDLESYNGDKIATLLARDSIKVVNDFNQRPGTNIVFLIFVVILAIGSIVTTGYFVILRPIEIIDEAIAKNDPVMLESIRHQKSEIGHIAQAVMFILLNQESRQPQDLRGDGSKMDMSKK